MSQHVSPEPNDPPSGALNEKLMAESHAEEAVDSCAQPVPPSAERQPQESTAEAPESTGNARVDEALTRLSELDEKPVQDHAAVVEDIHRALQDTLAEEEA